MESLLKLRKFEVYRRSVTGRDGNLRAQEFIRHPGAVVILPLLSETRCLMLRQFRPAIERELWELPAGTLDVPGESAEAAARRELEEETGHCCGRIEYLCEFYPSPGVMTELIRSYVAYDLTETRQRLEPTERIRVESMDLSEAMRLIDAGEIVDAKTIITLLRWKARNGGGP